MNAQAIIDFIKQFIEEFAPALAVALWNYEGSKVAAAEQNQKEAELKAKELQNEIDVEKSVSGLSDADAIKKLTDDGSNS